MKTSCFPEHYHLYQSHSSFIPELLYKRERSTLQRIPQKLSLGRVFLHTGLETMKRRNGTEAKRRPVRRTKISENFLGSTLVYLKLLILWVLVLAADYLLEFRFEYLWPFWLLVRSIYDSFKYQGLAFSVFFICIALTSDMICFLFIPVHWLFFAASTYVWVQYVWHTEKGICLPTVFLWLLFVYIEAAVRLRDYKLNLDVKNLPFHLDLCRPFAAHCIGYPVVTLGFGFKSYVGYRMRQRRQKEIQKENETYFSLMRAALPPGPAREDAFNPQPSPKSGLEDRISNGIVGVLPGAEGAASSDQQLSRSPDKQLAPDSSPDISKSNGSASKSLGLSNGDVDTSCLERDPPDQQEQDEQAKSLARSTSKSYGTSGGNKETGKKAKEDKKPESSVNPILIKLESDVKRLKCDLQLSRNRENELREQIVCYMSSERGLKSEISSLLVEKSTQEARINSLLSSRAGEKQLITSLEKKLSEEKKVRSEYQLKLETERKNKKEANAERAVAVAQQNVNSGTISKLEAEIARLKDELARSEQRAAKADEEMKEMKKNAGAHGDPKELATALSLAQEQKAKLETTLSSEQKVKMDLFSALGGARRQLQINEELLMSKDREILELKSNIAELLAVMPTSGGGNDRFNGNNGTSLPSVTSAAPGAGAKRATDAAVGSHKQRSFEMGGVGSLGLSSLSTQLTGGVSVAPGGFPASSSRSSGLSGLFIPSSLDLNTEASLAELPAGIELSTLANLGGLGDIDDNFGTFDANNPINVTSSMYTATTHSFTNGGINDA